MTKTLFRLVLAVWMLVLSLALASITAQAQSILSLGGSSDTTASDEAATGGMAEALKQAAEAGVSVVVVDTAGTLMGTAAGQHSGPEETAPEMR